jgi:hypothetical protein
MKTKTLLPILAATVSTLVATTSHATVFTFSGADNGLSTITRTVDGITLSVSNPAPSSTFFAFGTLGLGVLANGIITTTSFNLSFSSPVQLIGYNVGAVQALDGDESLTLTAGSSTSVESSPFTTGARNFSNQFTVAANQTISVVAAGADFIDLILWSSITANPASVPTTPEPSGLVALGIIGLGLLGAKKRTNG